MFMDVARNPSRPRWGGWGQVLLYEVQYEFMNIHRCILLSLKYVFFTSLEKKTKSAAGEFSKTLFILDLEV